MINLILRTLGIKLQFKKNLSALELQIEKLVCLLKLENHNYEEVIGQIKALTEKFKQVLKKANKFKDEDKNKPSYL